MSATDELRRLLDERGVKYWDMKTRGIWFGINADGSDHSYEAYDQTNSLIEIATFDLTPEQAIAATLGSGTVEKAAERIEVLSGFAREYLHRYGMLMSMAGEDVTDEVLAMESAINEVCGRKVVDE